MEKAKILVVEDEAIVAVDIRNRLRNLGHTVSALTASGPEAIDRTGELHPDLVLMDIQLRGRMDGVDAADHIRHRFHVPVVYLTANSDENTLQRAKLSEPFGYLSKPFAERELETTIEMALHRHRMEKKLERSEALKNAILESALDGIITMDHEGRIMEFNPAAERIFGHARREVVGELMADLLLAPAMREHFWQDMTRFLLTNEGRMIGRRTEVTARRADGSEFPAELAVTQIDMEGPPMFTAYVRDITDHVRREQEMDEFIGRLQAELGNVKKLTGLLPICASCKKIRDEHKQWHEIENYVRAHSEAEFTHGYCPQCAQKVLDSLPE